VRPLSVPFETSPASTDLNANFRTHRCFLVAYISTSFNVFTIETSHFTVLTLNPFVLNVSVVRIAHHQFKFELPGSPDAQFVEDDLGNDRSPSCQAADFSLSGDQTDVGPIEAPMKACL
jgi:hypothetical protein